MARLRLYALTTLGGLCLVYELVVEAMSPRGQALSDLVWILSVVPMYAVGAWLTWRLPTHPQPVRLLVSGTAFVATGAFGSFIASQPEMIESQWAPVFSTFSLEAQAVGSLAVALLIGGYPDGSVERSWQRLTLRCSWIVLIGPPLALLASPVVPVSPFIAEDLTLPNPYAVSWLAWLAQPAIWLAVNSWWVSVVGVLVLCARFVAADAAGRARMRVLFVVVVVGITLYAAGTVALALGAPEDSALVVTLISLGSLTAILLPGAIIYGILRHRLFDLDLVVRKSVAYGAASLLIAAAYAVIAAAPGMMLGNRVPVTLAVVVTIAAALAFQPLRRRLESAVSRRLFGDRVEQYQLLKNLGTTMEQTAELGELLPRLAHAIRGGMGASWVQVRLCEGDGSWLDEPQGVAGEVNGESAAGVDLVRAGELVGRVDLGPKPGGYAAADLELLGHRGRPGHHSGCQRTARVSAHGGTRRTVHLSRPAHCSSGRGAASDRARPARRDPAGGRGAHRRSSARP